MSNKIYPQDCGVWGSKLRTSIYQNRLPFDILVRPYFPQSAAGRENQHTPAGKPSPAGMKWRLPWIQDP